jgi:hypothetical protein
MLALLCSTTVLADPPAGKLETVVKSFAAGLAALNNWGADRNATKKIAKLGPRVEHDLRFAGEGGILLVAKIEVQKTDAGDFKKLIDVDYVGIGRTPADAQLASMSRQTGGLGENITPDPEASTYYWFKKNANGTMRVSQAPLGVLRRDVLALYSQRTLAHYDWREAHREELDRFIKLYSKATQATTANAEMDALIKSRRESLAKLDKINTELKSALESANRAAQNGKLLTILGVGASLASAIQTATNGLSPSDAAKVQSATTFEEAQAALDGIRKQAEADVERLYNSLSKEQQQEWQLEFSIEGRLKENNYPVDNLPTENPPPVRIDQP